MPRKQVVKKAAETIPAEILEKVRHAVRSGKSMLAVWHIEGGEVKMYRVALQFPSGDLDPALRLLMDDIEMMKAEIG